MSEANTNIKKEKRGKIFYNEKKLTEKSPDLTGNFLLEGKEWKISLWKNTSNDGKEYLSASISELTTENNQPKANYQSAPQPGGQPIIRPEPTPGAIVDLSSDDLSDLDNILGLTDEDNNNPFN